MNKILSMLIAAHLSCGVKSGVAAGENDTEASSEVTNTTEVSDRIVQCAAVGAAAWFYSSDRDDCYYATWALCGHDGPSRPVGRQYMDENTCKEQNHVQHPETQASI